MSDKEEKGFIDSLFDKADRIADGLNAMVTPAGDGNVIDAEFSESERRVTRTIVFGGIPSRHDRRGLIWHAFFETNQPPICGREFHPEDIEAYRRANTTSHEAIVFCFACLSRLVGSPKTAKQLGSGK